MAREKDLDAKMRSKGSGRGASRIHRTSGEGGVETGEAQTRRRVPGAYLCLYSIVLFATGVLLPAIAYSTVGARIPEGHFLEWGSALAVALAGLAAINNLAWLKGKKRRLIWLCMALGFFAFAYMELDTDESSATHVENYISTLLIVALAMVVAWPVLRDMLGMGVSAHLLSLGLAALILAQLSDSGALGYEVYKNFTILEESSEFFAACCFLLSHVEAYRSHLENVPEHPP
jgi:hypothetical protein